MAEGPGPAGAARCPGRSDRRLVAEAQQELLLLLRDAPRPLDGEVERHEQGAAGDGQPDVVEELVMAREGRGGDARDPDLPLQWLRGVDDRQLVPDVVRGDDGATAQASAFDERRP